MATCERFDELEYALGLMDETEELAVAEHLLTCAQHSELAGLQSTGVALAFAGGEREPPIALRARVLGAVAQKNPESKGRFARRRLWVPAAAAAVLVLAFAAWVTLPLESGEDDALFVKAFHTDSAIDVEVLADFSQPSARITYAGLIALPAGHEYSAWVIRGEEWLKMGAFRPNEEGGWSGEFAFQLDPSDKLCLTSGPPLDNYGERRDEPLFIEPLTETGPV